jgi:hypothetical protein
MALSGISLILKNNLESLPILAARYENLRLANYNALTQEKRGCFSLVFSADDIQTGEKGRDQIF